MDALTAEQITELGVVADLITARVDPGSIC